MQADPIGEVTGLYGWLAEPVTDEFEQRMQSWWTLAAAERDPVRAPTPSSSASTSTRYDPASPATSSTRTAGPSHSAR